MILLTNRMLPRFLPVHCNHNYTLRLQRFMSSGAIFKKPSANTARIDYDKRGYSNYKDHRQGSIAWKKLHSHPQFFELHSVAFGSSLLAFLMTSMQKLRCLIALSSTSYALYYYIYPSAPLWLDVGAEVSLVTINVFMLAYLAWSNSRIRFDQRELFLYANEFST